MEYQDDYSFSYPYLTPGETILWKGRPQKGHLFTSRDIIMIPFSLLWCSFAFFWEFSAIQGGAPLPFALFGLPFIAIGLYMLFGQWIRAAYLRKRTAYVITNLKIIRKRGNKVDMLDCSTIPPLQIHANRDGSGTISFTIVYSGAYSGRRSGGHTLFELENIPDVAKVHALLMTRNQH